MNTTRGTSLAVLLLVLWVAVSAQAAITSHLDNPPGWGCFANRATIGGMDNWRAHVRLMKTAGMNTFVLSYASPEQLAEQIDIALEEDMLEWRIPVVAMACFNTSALASEAEKAYEAQHPISGFGVGELHGNAAAYRIAKSLSRYQDRFPEIVGYTPDEPGRGEPVTDGTLAALQTIHAGYKRVGVRLAGALCYPNTGNLLDLVDIPILNIIIGGDTYKDRAALQAQGREWWTYHISLRNSTPSLIRYHVGLWFWQSGARVNLNWNWAGMVGDQDMAAPVLNARLTAFRSGVEDYMRLQADAARYEPLKRDWTGDIAPVGWWLTFGGERACPSPVDMDALLGGGAE